VRLIRLAEGERLTGIERIEHLEGETIVEAAAEGSGEDAKAEDVPPSE
jgi:hypothetical protein